MTRIDNLNSWHSDWRGLRVVVLGLGVTGFSVADTLCELGAEVLVLAERAEPELEDVLDVIGVTHLTGAKVDLSNEASFPAELIAFEAQLVITSPGFKPQHPLIQWAERSGLPLWIDVDLAWRLRDKTARVAEWFVVTGTNGKTTTCQMLEAIFLQNDMRSTACGNIGKPILDAIRDPEGFDALVVELSSFQLHYLGAISPYSSVVLNLADDHLDWHGGFDAYRDAKAKIYENTRIACVYNVQDAATETLVENADVVEGARAIGFSLGAPARSQVGFVEDILCDRAFIENRQDEALEITTIDDLSHIGVLTPHLMANVAAATALARSFEVPASIIREALRAFRLDAHRIDVVAKHSGITWIDDSKATNPHAAAASLASFESVVWIVGGLLKGVDLTDLVAKFAPTLKAAVIIGADRADLLAIFAKVASEVPIFEVQAKSGLAVMTGAVEFASQLAVDGDTVLLAPAAASMDQFKDYEDRGQAFAVAVQEHLGKS